jgi:hypothetical protein
MPRKIMGGRIIYDLRARLSQRIIFHRHPTVHAAFQFWVIRVNPAVHNGYAHAATRAPTPGPFPRNRTQWTADSNIPQRRGRKCF